MGLFGWFSKKKKNDEPSVSYSEPTESSVDGADVEVRDVQADPAVIAEYEARMGKKDNTEAKKAEEARKAAAAKKAAEEAAAKKAAEEKAAKEAAAKKAAEEAAAKKAAEEKAAKEAAEKKAAEEAAAKKAAEEKAAKEAAEKKAAEEAAAKEAEEEAAKKPTKKVVRKVVRKVVKEDDTTEESLPEETPDAPAEEAAEAPAEEVANSPALDENNNNEKEVAPMEEEKKTYTGRFEINRSKSGEQFFFNLYAANKVGICTSQMYASASSALHGVQSVINFAATAPIEDQTLKDWEKITYPKWEIYLDKGGKYRFRLSANNGSCICHSQGYTTKNACKNGINSIIRSSRDPEIDKAYLVKKDDEQ